MDQSKIAKLLAECGNGDLMIEVKQVRINAVGGTGISIGGAAAYAGAGGDGSSDGSTVDDSEGTSVARP